MSDEVRDNVRKGKDPGGRFILPELVKGYGVTLREFFTKPTTMQYPEEKWTLPPRFRGYPKLVPNPDGTERCVACGLCAVVCPPIAIQLQADGGPGNDILIGGDGNDVLVGGDGDDVQIGGPGLDVLDGAFGDNVVIQLVGSPPHDLLFA